MNKALDLNKLFNEHKKGKLLKKHPVFPMWAGIKYDGNYVTVIVDNRGDPIFTTSGGHVYNNDAPTIFDDVAKGVYIAERIATDGKLGDRKNCSLRGPRGSQTAYGHSYMVHGYIPLEDFSKGRAIDDYEFLRDYVTTFIPAENVVQEVLINNMEELKLELDRVVALGYEGIIGKRPSWLWKNTKSRTIDLIKYKTRPTVDLLVIGTKEGDKKYEGMIGSLILRDKTGRTVDVGSGMTDAERLLDPNHFIGAVVELFYEQIMDTYIQPTFGDEYEGVLIRHDKTKEDID